MDMGAREKGHSGYPKRIGNNFAWGEYGGWVSSECKID